MKVYITRHLLAGFGAPAEDKEFDESNTPIGEIYNTWKRRGDFINLRYEHDKLEQQR